MWLAVGSHVAGTCESIAASRAPARMVRALRLGWWLGFLTVAVIRSYVSKGTTFTVLR